MRLVNMSTKMCRKVISAPLNTSKHVSKMMTVPGIHTSDSVSSSEGYVLSVAGNYLALQKLPLSGSPRFYCLHIFINHFHMSVQRVFIQAG